MDSTNKSINVTAQGVSEPPGPVSVSNGYPASAQPSSCDWANDEGRGVPEAIPR